MQFEFATAARIVFGAGRSRDIPSLCKGMGGRPLVVTGARPARSAFLLEGLREAGFAARTLRIKGEPTTTDIEAGVIHGREEDCDFVIGIGGGSVVDAAKAVAALLTNRGDLLDYLEVIGAARPLTEAPAPCVAVPTTAGTGAEVTRNAVIASPDHRVKASMRDARMLPNLAVVDPELTWSMPPPVTASTGLDALTQLLEVFVSNRPNPLTDGICREGMAHAAHALRRAYTDGSDAAAREEMAAASLFGGLALANARLGAVHGFAGPIGGMFPAPHGVVCASLLPHVMATNARALAGRAPDSPTLERFDEVARILTGDPAATCMDGVEWVQDLCAALRVPPLSRCGVSACDFPDVVEAARRASSMKGNPVELTDEELMGILRAACGEPGRHGPGLFHGGTADGEA